MPEYFLPIDDFRSWSKLSKFVQGYIEAALFSGVELPPDHPEGDRRKHDEAAFDDIEVDTLAEMVRDCEKFQADPRVAPLLQEAYRGNYTEEQAGRDFWFTRNGHGVGFWSRSKNELSAGHGAALSELVGTFTDYGEYNLFCEGTDDEGYTVHGCEG